MVLHVLIEEWKRTTNHVCMIKDAYNQRVQKEREKEREKERRNGGEQEKEKSERIVEGEGERVREKEGMKERKKWGGKKASRVRSVRGVETRVETKNRSHAPRKWEEGQTLFVRFYVHVSQTVFQNRFLYIHKYISIICITGACTVEMTKLNLLSLFLFNRGCRSIPYLQLYVYSLPSTLSQSKMLLH